MGFNILIVDDSAVTRALIKRTIKLTDIPLDNIYEAASGKSGLEALTAHRVDLILADLHMPEMSGVEMTIRILANVATRAIPVVIVSAEPNDERIAALKDFGIKGYLKKPITPDCLRELFTQLLGTPHV